MYVTNVVGPTQGVTAILCSSQSSGNGREIEIATPINVQKLEDTSNHPDQQFVSRLCNYLSYGADVGFTGRRIARFSRNLPTALS